MTAIVAVVDEDLRVRRRQHVRRRIVERVNAGLAGFDRQGLSPVAAYEGSIGTGARAIGAACLPILANFAIDREVLFKDSPTPNPNSRNELDVRSSGAGSAQSTYLMQSGARPPRG